MIERFTLERVVPSPATFDYEKLDWLNGMHLRALSPDEYADELVKYLRSEGYDWDERLVRRAAPIVQEKIERFGQFPDFAGFLFREIDPQALALPTGGAPVVTAAQQELERVEPFAAAEIESALRGLAERLELSPARLSSPFASRSPVRRYSPGLFESLELLGKERRASVSVLLPIAQRLRLGEGVERALKGEPRAASELRRGAGECGRHAVDLALNSPLGCCLNLPFSSSKRNWRKCGYASRLPPSRWTRPATPSRRRRTTQPSVFSVV